MLNNNEIKALIIALGTGIGETFDIEKIRYKRVVIMTDADVDGAHIRTLLLTLFYRYFKEIIEAGYLYIAQPPLFKLAKGKKSEYAYTEDAKVKILGEWGVVEEAEPEEEEEVAEKEGEITELEGKPTTKTRVSIQRYKGLGEMNPDQLWETTMDPERRTMFKVTVEDAEMADAIFDTLMGSEVLPRRKFIQTHAKKVKNLDI
jgi:DNA gyrase subunit B